ncbi:LAME_0E04478g1_1 [Lachancea meyersii CBS 8951]|uniref:LAME_0E04478g1_1 n=1 Tax=Lachancea meyersii CBS 8951 TaxID=1266667 RepID=A0A1G4JH24_9SACH|nr:LAME_0E04478g1_1 [Lachancea meyersii CBS 8951]
MGISGLVGAFFPAPKQLELLEKMLETNRFDELHDVLEQIEFDASVVARIEVLATARVLGGLEAFWGSEDADPVTVGVFAPLLAKLDKTFSAIQEWAAQKLVGAPPGSLALLGLLETTFTIRNGQESPQNQQLYQTLVSLLASDDPRVSNASCQIIKWQTAEIAALPLQSSEFDGFVWAEIAALLTRDSTQVKSKNGLLHILRSLLLKTTPSACFLAFVKTTAFWSALKSGLAHESHEIRKYSLSILRLILQTFPKEELISNDLMTWDPSSSLHSETSAAWSKFITLYEIVALDTALNQLEAASGDILDLLDSTAINAEWGLVLFSTGLKAAMESVRRHTVKLMFQVKNKAIFHTNAQEVSSYYLPASMFAPYFIVEDGKCSYGDALCAFVTQLIVHTHQSHFSHQVPEMVSSILKCLYDQRMAFDPPRIYICLGLYRALSSLKLQVLDEDNISVISKLFEVSSEEGVFECILQTLYLKMLMHVKVDTSPAVWISALAKHVRANKGSYQYLSPVLDDFIDTSLKCFGKNQIEFATSQMQPDDCILQVLSYTIFGVKPVVVDLSFLKELGKSDMNLESFKSDYANALSDLISCKAERAEYENADVLTTLPIFGSQTWNAVKLDTLYNALRTNFSADQFTFFTSCYLQTTKHSMMLTPFELADIFDLYELLKNHCKETMVGTFKYKDSVYGGFFKLLLAFLRSNALQTSSDSSEDELAKVIALMGQNVHADNGNYEGNLRIMELCEFLLNNYVLSRLQGFDGRQMNDFSVVQQIVDILCTIWDFVARDRLVLNQRKLHLKFIETLFHPTVLFFAVGKQNPDSDLGSTLSRYGSEIVTQSISRRTFLPTLGGRINKFMETFGKDLKSQAHDYSWLIDLIFRAFVQSQDSVNSFKLKPIVARLFDEQVDSLRGRFGSLYDRVYQIPEISCRVFLISAVLHASDEFRQDVFVDRVASDVNLLKANKSTNGTEEQERLLKWQMLMLTMKSIELPVLKKHVQDEIMCSVAAETSPLIRVYSEWIVAIDLCHTCLDETPSQTEIALFEMLEDQSKPSLAVTATRVIFVSLKSVLGVKDCKRLLHKFIPKVISNCASNKPLVRHFSNSLMLTLWPLFNDFLTDKTLASVLENLYLNAQKLQVHGQFRLGDAVIWDLNKDLNLTSIFGGVLMKITDHNVPYIDEATFKKHLTSMDQLPVGRDESDLWLGKRSGLKESSETHQQKGSPLQTKSGAWEAVMNFAEKKSGGAVKRTPLIVVASLVDKAPNLGGICRLCDVLGAGLLTIHDIRMKDQPQFKSVAVTADRWMPMEAVAVDEIVQFMRAKKKEGYTLIGLEQTDKSLQLDNKYSFPEKSLILLGTEAEGIPGHLLGELDLCLEIKQSGVIRSMNIQTATAVIVHSYSAQHT